MSKQVNFKVLVDQAYIILNIYSYQAEILFKCSIYYFVLAYIFQFVHIVICPDVPKERQLEMIMERLRSKSQHLKSWVENAKAFRMALVVIWNILAVVKLSIHIFIVILLLNELDIFESHCSTHTMGITCYCLIKVLPDFRIKGTYWTVLNETNFKNAWILCNDL